MQIKKIKFSCVIALRNKFSVTGGLEKLIFHHKILIQVLDFFSHTRFWKSWKLLFATTKNSHFCTKQFWSNPKYFGDTYKNKALDSTSDFLTLN